MARDRSVSSSDSDDRRSDRKGRDDRRRDERRSDRRDSDRDRRRRSTRSRSRSRSRDRGSRRRDYHKSRSSRNDSRHGDQSMKRQVLATHFTQPAIDPQEFDQWVQILGKCDQQQDIENSREKYNTFLHRYPNCYGFWIKFAEFEKKFGTMQTSKEVWERGIITLPLSIDLWIGYINQMKTVAEFPSYKIRELYNRALDIAGMEYTSDKLWLEAIEFERQEYIHEMCCANEDANCRKIGELFDKLLTTPTLHTASHLERFIVYINSVEPNLLLSSSEYEEIFKTVRKALDKGIDELVHETEQTYTVKKSGARDQLTIVAEADEESYNVTVKRLQLDPEVARLIRLEIIDRRRRVFEDTMQMCQQRAGFEANIKRPYFHVKPLEYPELFNWMAYLDFEISEGNEDRIRTLFERCLIAGCLYEEFWIKYARWAWKSKNSKSDVRDIYKRAQVHVPTSVNMTMSWSAFEESVDNQKEALGVLDDFKRNNPGYVLLELRYIGILRREAEKKGESTYSSVASQYEQLVRSSEGNPNLYSFYSLKLARFQHKVRNDSKLAQKIVKRAITVDPLNLQLFSQLVDIAYSAVDMNEEDILQAFDCAFDSNIRLEDKIRFSQRKLDFLEELGTDITAIENHRDFHYQLLAQLPDNTTLRTRFMNDQARIQVAIQPQPLAPQQQPQQIPNWQQQQSSPMQQGMPVTMQIMPQPMQMVQQAGHAYLGQPIGMTAVGGVPKVQLKIVE